MWTINLFSLLACNNIRLIELTEYQVTKYETNIRVLKMVIRKQDDGQIQ